MNRRFLQLNEDIFDKPAAQHECGYTGDNGTQRQSRADTIAEYVTECKPQHDGRKKLG